MKKTEPLRVVILGVGSDAQVAAEMIISSGLALNNSEMVGFLDGNLSLAGEIKLGERIFGLP
ncbi:MAG: hypothetical protein HQ574_09245 [Chloroflexi bacterium]|nr:hypothetical protein [Chloroflexota bacterium]